MEKLFELKSKSLRFTGVTLQNPHGTLVPAGVTAVVGTTAAGKTSLANILENGRNFMTNDIRSHIGEHPVIRSMAFDDIHSLAGFKVEYYQQRYESMMNDEVPTVAEALGHLIHSPEVEALVHKLRIKDFAQKRLNFLSSGELRKLLIVKMLTELPQVLILDNPFIGLDIESKAVVEDLIRDIASQGISILLLVSDIADIPPCAMAAIPIHNLEIGATVERLACESIEDFRKQFEYLFDFHISDAQISEIIQEQDSRNLGQEVVAMHNCRVCYGEHVLVEHIDWTIKQGECWALSGPNGAGKSTLLSLINADNPQAYSNDIRIFGQKRGTGESIWDLKKRIGFLSSELHLYYHGLRNTVEAVIGEGFNRALGSFQPLDASQKDTVDKWIRLFALEPWRHTCFNDLSAGHQRLVLLLRALVRQPEFLILDEPVHGLDRGIKQAVNRVVNHLARSGATIIYVTHCPDELPECITQAKRLSNPAVVAE